MVSKSIERKATSTGLASMFGRANPFPDGVYRDLMKEEERRPNEAVWSWSDLDGNGKVDVEEVTSITDKEIVSSFHNLRVQYRPRRKRTHVQRCGDRSAFDGL